MDFKGEQTGGFPKIESFKSPYVETRGRTIIANAEAVAFPFWQQMIDETQRDKRERGMAVSKIGNELLTSKIFIGQGERRDYDGNIVSASFSFPFLSHGLRSLDPRIKDIVVIHTHPMPPDLDHLATTVFSDGDIRAFIEHAYNGLVSLDRGGAHLLVRTDSRSDYKELFEKNIVKEIMNNVIEKGGKVIDVIKQLSQELPKYGLWYYFVPWDLIPKQGSKHVQFHDPKNLPSVT